MAEDLEISLEGARLTMASLAHSYDDYVHGALNISDLQKAVKKAIEILGGEKERIRRERLFLRARIGGGPPDPFRCLDDKFGEYSSVLGEARSLSLHSDPGKIMGAYIKSCQLHRLLIETAGMLGGYREYLEVIGQYIELKKLVRPEQLLKLLTIRTTGVLFGQVGEFWNGTAYQEGFVALGICKARIGGLLSKKCPPPESAERLTARLDVIRLLGDRAERLFPGNTVLSFDEVGGLREMITKGYLALAERLIYDLEFVAAPCGMFFSEYDRYLQFIGDGPGELVSLEEIKAAIEREGWKVAAFKLSVGMLHSNSEMLIRLNLEVSENQGRLAKIVKALSPPEEAEEETAPAGK
jgi:hypothetical protein